MYILAIESSHDDSSLAIYENKKIIWEKTISQTNFHKQFGGTIPEFAARHHVDNFALIIEELKQNIDLKKIKKIAFTALPGLKGSLQIGSLIAHGLAHSLNIPIVPINHMHGHILSVEFSHKILFPALSLIISGGHSQLWYLKNYNDMYIIGETRDDAIGEVFDKVARILNLGFPGGPIIDKITHSYKGDKINFNLKFFDNYQMSFSGLKTKIINIFKSKEVNNVLKIAASFQITVVDYFHNYMQKAILEFKPHSIILGGGVSANSHIRKMFLKLHKNALIPNIEYTTDNASMIAIAADLQSN